MWKWLLQRNGGGGGGAGLKGEDGSKATVSPLSTPSSTSTPLLQEVLLNCSLYSPLFLPAPVVNSEIGE